MAQAQRRLEAYAEFLVAASEVLETYRELLAAMPARSDQLDPYKANSQMADLAAPLHRAFAVVALTGSDLGRREGKRVYDAARVVAASRIVVVHQDDSHQDHYEDYDIIRADEKALEAAIDAYKAALVPETTALP